MRTFNNKFHIWDFKSHYITDGKEALTAIKLLEGKKDKLLGIDIETAKLVKYIKPEELKKYDQTGLCPHLSRIRLIQIFDGEAVYVFDMFKLDISKLKNLLVNGRFVAHNGIFELKHFLHNKLPNLNIGCSMLISQLVHSAEFPSYEPVVINRESNETDDTDQTGLAKYKRASHSLDAVVQRLFGVKVDKQMQVSDWGDTELTDDQINYAALDPVLSYHAALNMLPKLKTYKLEKIYKLQKETQHVIAQMELNGLPVDWEYHATLIEKWKAEEIEALKKCEPFFGKTNMRSGKQMNKWLTEYLKDDALTLSKWPKTDKCKCNPNFGSNPCVCGAPYGFDKKQMAEFKYLPAVDALLNYKRYAILLSTFGESLALQKHPVTGRLHTSYTLGFTSTGRMSSRNPNLQNCPNDKDFRNIFKAEKGYVLVVADFNSIELRLQAEFSKDIVMCNTFKDNKDIYKVMASHVYGTPYSSVIKEQRKIGKVCMLALGYGMRAKKLGKYGLGAGINQTQVFWDKAYRSYTDLYNQYCAWCDRMRNRATKLGYIETLTGKRCKLDKKEIYTCAPNRVIQGTAAELNQDALIRCAKSIFGSNTQLVCTVHDEILLHAPVRDAQKASDYLSNAMNSAMKEMFPNAVSHQVADASFGERWGDVKEG